MFGKKKKEIKKPVAETAKDDAIDMITNDEIDLNEKIKSYQQNVRTPKDCLAPSEISVVDDETLKVGENYVRNYVMQGYPNAAYVGWLDKIYSSPGRLLRWNHRDRLKRKEAPSQTFQSMTRRFSC